MRETLRVGGPVWAHSNDYSPTLSIGQAIGQVSWSTAVDLPAVAAASGQSGHRGHCLDLRPQVVEALGRMRRAGPRWVRGASEPAGPRGTSGQCRRTRIAGQRPFTLSTSDREAARRWVRIPPPDTKAAQSRSSAGRLSGHAVWSRHSGQWSGLRPRSRVRWNSRPQAPQVRTSTSGWLDPPALGRGDRSCGLSFAR
jgi:hypothetical protein